MDKVYISGPGELFVHSPDLELVKSFQKRCTMFTEYFSERSSIRCSDLHDSLGLRPVIFSCLNDGFCKLIVDVNDQDIMLGLKYLGEILVGHIKELEHRFGLGHADERFLKKAAYHKPDLSIPLCFAVRNNKDLVGPAG